MCQLLARWSQSFVKLLIYHMCIFNNLVIFSAEQSTINISNIENSVKDNFDSVQSMFEKKSPKSMDKINQLHFEEMKPQNESSMKKKNKISEQLGSLNSKITELFTDIHHSLPVFLHKRHILSIDDKTAQPTVRRCKKRMRSFKEKREKSEIYNRRKRKKLICHERRKLASHSANHLHDLSFTTGVPEFISSTHLKPQSISSTQNATVKGIVLGTEAAPFEEYKYINISGKASKSKTPEKVDLVPKPLKKDLINKATRSRIANVSSADASFNSTPRNCPASVFSQNSLAVPSISDNEKFKNRTSKITSCIGSNNISSTNIQFLSKRGEISKVPPFQTALTSPIGTDKVSEAHKPLNANNLPTDESLNSVCNLEKALNHSESLAVSPKSLTNNSNFKDVSKLFDSSNNSIACKAKGSFLLSKAGKGNDLNAGEASANSKEVLFPLSKSVNFKDEFAKVSIKGLNDPQVMVPILDVGANVIKDHASKDYSSSTKSNLSSSLSVFKLLDSVQKQRQMFIDLNNSSLSIPIFRNQSRNQTLRVDHSSLANITLTLLDNVPTHSKKVQSHSLELVPEASSHSNIRSNPSELNEKANDFDLYSKLNSSEKVLLNSFIKSRMKSFNSLNNKKIDSKCSCLKNILESNVEDNFSIPSSSIPINSLTESSVTTVSKNSCVETVPLGFKIPKVDLKDKLENISVASAGKPSNDEMIEKINDCRNFDGGDKKNKINKSFSSEKEDLGEKSDKMDEAGKIEKLEDTSKVKKNDKTEEGGKIEMHTQTENVIIGESITILNKQVPIDKNKKSEDRIQDSIEKNDRLVRPNKNQKSNRTERPSIKIKPGKDRKLPRPTVYNPKPFFNENIQTFKNKTKLVDQNQKVCLEKLKLLEAISNLLINDSCQSYLPSRKSYSSPKHGKIHDDKAVMKDLIPLDDLKKKNIDNEKTVNLTREFIDNTFSVFNIVTKLPFLMSNVKNKDFDVESIRAINPKMIVSSNQNASDQIALKIYVDGNEIYNDLVSGKRLLHSMELNQLDLPDVKNTSTISSDLRHSVKQNYPSRIKNAGRETVNNSVDVSGVLPIKSAVKKTENFFEKFENNLANVGKEKFRIKREKERSKTKAAVSTNCRRLKFFNDNDFNRDVGGKISNLYLENGRGIANQEQDDLTPLKYVDAESMGKESYNLNPCFQEKKYKYRSSCYPPKFSRSPASKSVTKPSSKQFSSVSNQKTFESSGSQNASISSHFHPLTTTYLVLPSTNSINLVKNFTAAVNFIHYKISPFVNMKTTSDYRSAFQTGFNNYQNFLSHSPSDSITAGFHLSSKASKPLILTSPKSGILKSNSDVKKFRQKALEIRNDTKSVAHLNVSIEKNKGTSTKMCTVPSLDQETYKKIKPGTPQSFPHGACASDLLNFIMNTSSGNATNSSIFINENSNHTLRPDNKNKFQPEILSAETMQKNNSQEYYSLVNAQHTNTSDDKKILTVLSNNGTSTHVGTEAMHFDNLSLVFDDFPVTSMSPPNLTMHTSFAQPNFSLFEGEESQDSGSKGCDAYNKYPTSFKSSDNAESLNISSFTDATTTKFSLEVVSTVSFAKTDADFVFNNASQSEVLSQARKPFQSLKKDSAAVKTTNEISPSSEKAVISELSSENISEYENPHHFMTSSSKSNVYNNSASLKIQVISSSSFSQSTSPDVFNVLLTSNCFNSTLALFKNDNISSLKNLSASKSDSVTSFKTVDLSILSNQNITTSNKSAVYEQPPSVSVFENATLSSIEDFSFTNENLTIGNLMCQETSTTSSVKSTPPYKLLNASKCSRKFSKNENGNIKNVKSESNFESLSLSEMFNSINSNASSSSHANFKNNSFKFNPNGMISDFSSTTKSNQNILFPAIVNSSLNVLNFNSTNNASVPNLNVSVPIFPSSTAVSTFSFRNTSLSSSNSSLSVDGIYSNLFNLLIDEGKTLFRTPIDQSFSPNSSNVSLIVTQNFSLPNLTTEEVSNFTFAKISNTPNHFAKNFTNSSDTFFSKSDLAPSNHIQFFSNSSAIILFNSSLLHHLSLNIDSNNNYSSPYSTFFKSNGSSDKNLNNTVLVKADDNSVQLINGLQNITLAGLESLAVLKKNNSIFIKAENSSNHPLNSFLIINANNVIFSSPKNPSFRYVDFITPEAREVSSINPERTKFKKPVLEPKDGFSNKNHFGHSVTTFIERATVVTKDNVNDNGTFSNAEVENFENPVSSSSANITIAPVPRSFFAELRKFENSTTSNKKVAAESADHLSTTATNEEKTVHLSNEKVSSSKDFLYEMTANIKDRSAPRYKNISSISSDITADPMGLKSSPSTGVSAIPAGHSNNLNQTSLICPDNFERVDGCNHSGFSPTDIVFLKVSSHDTQKPIIDDDSKTHKSNCLNSALIKSVSCNRSASQSKNLNSSSSNEVKPPTNSNKFFSASSLKAFFPVKMTTLIIKNPTLDPSEKDGNIQESTPNLYPTDGIQKFEKKKYILPKLTTGVRNKMQYLTPVVLLNKSMPVKPSQKFNKVSFVERKNPLNSSNLINHIHLVSVNNQLILTNASFPEKKLSIQFYENSSVETNLSSNLVTNLQLERGEKSNFSKVTVDQYFSTVSYNSTSELSSINIINDNIYNLGRNGKNLSKLVPQVADNHFSNYSAQCDSMKNVTNLTGVLQFDISGINESSSKKMDSLNDNIIPDESVHVLKSNDITKSLWDVGKSEKKSNGSQHQGMNNISKKYGNKWELGRNEVNSNNLVIRKINNNSANELNDVKNVLNSNEPTKTKYDHGYFNKSTSMQEDVRQRSLTRRNESNLDKPLDSLSHHHKYINKLNLILNETQSRNASISEHHGNDYNSDMIFKKYSVTSSESTNLVNHLSQNNGLWKSVEGVTPSIESTNAFDSSMKHVIMWDEMKDGENISESIQASNVLKNTTNSYKLTDFENNLNSHASKWNIMNITESIMEPLGTVMNNSIGTFTNKLNIENNVIFSEPTRSVINKNDEKFDDEGYSLNNLNSTEFAHVGVENSTDNFIDEWGDMKNLTKLNESLHFALKDCNNYTNLWRLIKSLANLSEPERSALTDKVETYFKEWNSEKNLTKLVESVLTEMNGSNDTVLSPWDVEKNTSLKESDFSDMNNSASSVKNWGVVENVTQLSISESNQINSSDVPDINNRIGTRDSVNFVNSNQTGVGENSNKLDSVEQVIFPRLESKISSIEVKNFSEGDFSRNLKEITKNEEDSSNFRGASKTETVPNENTLTKANDYDRKHSSEFSVPIQSSSEAMNDICNDSQRLANSQILNIGDEFSPQPKSQDIKNYENASSSVFSNSSDVEFFTVPFNYTTVSPPFQNNHSSTAPVHIAQSFSSKKKKNNLLIEINSTPSVSNVDIKYPLCKYFDDNPEILIGKGCHPSNIINNAQSFISSQISEEKADKPQKCNEISTNVNSDESHFTFNQTQQPFIPCSAAPTISNYSSIAHTSFEQVYTETPLKQSLNQVDLQSKVEVLTKNPANIFYEGYVRPAESGVQFLQAEPILADKKVSTAVYETELLNDSVQSVSNTIKSTTPLLLLFNSCNVAASNLAGFNLPTARSTAITGFSTPSKSTPSNPVSTFSRIVSNTKAEQSLENNSIFPFITVTQSSVPSVTSTAVVSKISSGFFPTSFDKPSIKNISSISSVTFAPDSVSPKTFSNSHNSVFHSETFAKPLNTVQIIPLTNSLVYRQNNSKGILLRNSVSKQNHPKGTAFTLLTPDKRRVFINRGHIETFQSSFSPVTCTNTSISLSNHINISPGESLTDAIKQKYLSTVSANVLKTRKMYASNPKFISKISTKPTILNRQTTIIRINSAATKPIPLHFNELSSLPNFNRSKNFQRNSVSSLPQFVIVSTTDSMNQHTYNVFNRTNDSKNSLLYNKVHATTANLFLRNINQNLSVKNQSGKFIMKSRMSAMPLLFSAILSDSTPTPKPFEVPRRIMTSVNHYPGGVAQLNLLTPVQNNSVAYKSNFISSSSDIHPNSTTIETAFVGLSHSNATSKSENRILGNFEDLEVSNFSCLKLPEENKHNFLTTPTTLIPISLFKAFNVDHIDFTSSKSSKNAMSNIPKTSSKFQQYFKNEYSAVNRFDSSTPHQKLSSLKMSVVAANQPKLYSLNVKATPNEKDHLIYLHKSEAVNQTIPEYYLVKFLPSDGNPLNFTPSASVSHKSFSDFHHPDLNAPSGSHSLVHPKLSVANQSNPSALSESFNSSIQSETAPVYFVLADSMTTFATILNCTYNVTCPVCPTSTSHKFGFGKKPSGSCPSNGTKSSNSSQAVPYGSKHHVHKKKNKSTYLPVEGSKSLTSLTTEAKDFSQNKSDKAGFFELFQTSPQPASTSLVVSSLVGSTTSHLLRSSSPRSETPKTVLSIPTLSDSSKIPKKLGPYVFFTRRPINRQTMCICKRVQDVFPFSDRPKSEPKSTRILKNVKPKRFPLKLVSDYRSKPDTSSVLPTIGSFILAVSNGSFVENPQFLLTDESWVRLPLNNVVPVNFDSTFNSASQNNSTNMIQIMPLSNSIFLNSSIPVPNNLFANNGIPSNHSVCVSNDVLGTNSSAPAINEVPIYSNMLMNNLIPVYSVPLNNFLPVVNAISVSNTNPFSNIASENKSSLLNNTLLIDTVPALKKSIGMNNPVISNNAIAVNYSTSAESSFINPSTAVNKSVAVDNSIFISHNISDVNTVPVSTLTPSNIDASFKNTILNDTFLKNNDVPVFKDVCLSRFTSPNFTPVSKNEIYLRSVSLISTANDVESTNNLPPVGSEHEINHSTFKNDLSQSVDVSLNSAVCGPNCNLTFEPLSNFEVSNISNVQNSFNPRDKILTEQKNVLVKYQILKPPVIILDPVSNALFFNSSKTAGSPKFILRDEIKAPLQPEMNHHLAAEPPLAVGIYNPVLIIPNSNASSIKNLAIPFSWESGAESSVRTMSKSEPLYSSQKYVDKTLFPCVTKLSSVEKMSNPIKTVPVPEVKLYKVASSPMVAATPINISVYSPEIRPVPLKKQNFINFSTTKRHLFKEFSNSATAHTSAIKEEMKSVETHANTVISSMLQHDSAVHKVAKPYFVHSKHNYRISSSKFESVTSGTPDSSARCLKGKQLSEDLNSAYTDSRINDMVNTNTHPPVLNFITSIASESCTGLLNSSKPPEEPLCLSLLDQVSSTPSLQTTHTKGNALFTQKQNFNEATTGILNLIKNSKIKTTKTAALLHGGNEISTNNTVKPLTYTPPIYFQSHQRLSSKEVNEDLFEMEELNNISSTVISSTLPVGSFFNYREKSRTKYKNHRGLKNTRRNMKPHTRGNPFYYNNFRKGINVQAKYSENNYIGRIGEERKQTHNLSHDTEGSSPANENSSSVLSSLLNQTETADPSESDQSASLPVIPENISQVIEQSSPVVKVLKNSRNKHKKVKSRLIFAPNVRSSLKYRQRYPDHRANFNVEFENKDPLFYGKFRRTLKSHQIDVNDNSPLLYNDYNSRTSNFDYKDFLESENNITAPANKLSRDISSNFIPALKEEKSNSRSPFVDSMKLDSDENKSDSNILKVKKEFYNFSKMFFDVLNNYSANHNCEAERLFDYESSKLKSKRYFKRENPILVLNDTSTYPLSLPITNPSTNNLNLAGALTPYLQWIPSSNASTVSRTYFQSSEQLSCTTGHTQLQDLFVENKATSNYSNYPFHYNETTPPRSIVLNTPVVPLNFDRRADSLLLEKSMKTVQKQGMNPAVPSNALRNYFGPKPEANSSIQFLQQNLDWFIPSDQNLIKNKNIIFKWVEKLLENPTESSKLTELSEQDCKTTYNSSCVCDINRVILEFDKIVCTKNVNEEIKLKKILDYHCSAYVPLPRGYNISGESKPRILTNKKKQMVPDDGSGPKKIDADGLNYLLHVGVTTTGNPLLHNAFTGSKISIPCFDNSKIQLPSGIADGTKYKWKKGDKAITDGRMKEQPDGVLVIENVILSDASHYTCTVLFVSPDSSSYEQRSFNHTLVVITVPKIAVQALIHYKTDSECSPEILEMFDLYLPQLIQESICDIGDDNNDICMIDIYNPVCFKNSTNNTIISLNVQMIIKSIEYLLVSGLGNKTFCSPLCHQKLYLKTTLILRENLRKALLTPVLGRTSFTGSDFIPTPEVLDLKMTIGCDAGFYQVENFCMPCPPHTYSEEGSTQCTICPVDFYQPQPGSKACLPCPFPLVPGCNTIFNIFNHRKKPGVGESLYEKGPTVKRHKEIRHGPKKQIGKFLLIMFSLSIICCCFTRVGLRLSLMERLKNIPNTFSFKKAKNGSHGKLSNSSGKNGKKKKSIELKEVKHRGGQDEKNSSEWSETRFQPALSYDSEITSESVYSDSPPSVVKSLKAGKERILSVFKGNLKNPKPKKVKHPEEPSVSDSVEVLKVKEKVSPKNYFSKENLGETRIQRDFSIENENSSAKDDESSSPRNGSTDSLQFDSNLKANTKQINPNIISHSGQNVKSSENQSKNSYQLNHGHDAPQFESSKNKRQESLYKQGGESLIGLKNLKGKKKVLTAKKMNTDKGHLLEVTSVEKNVYKIDDEKRLKRREKPSAVSGKIEKKKKSSLPKPALPKPDFT